MGTNNKKSHGSAMSYYYSYSFYIHKKEDYEVARLLVDPDDVDGSLERLGLSESLDDDDGVETISIDSTHGLQLHTLGRHKPNAKLLVASKSLGCELIQVRCEYDEWSEVLHYYRGKKIPKEHITALQRVYCPDFARSLRISSLFELRDLSALKRELDDGLELDGVFDGEPLLFKSAQYPTALTYLLERGANPDIRNKYGQTLLMEIVEDNASECLQVARVLVDKGADLTLEYPDNGGSLLWNANAWDRGLAKKMQEKGAPMVPDEDAYAETDLNDLFRVAIDHHDTSMQDKLLGQVDMSKESISEYVDVSVDADNLPMLKHFLETGYGWLDEDGEDQLLPKLTQALEACSFDVALFLIGKAEAQQLDWSECVEGNLTDIASHPDAYDVLVKVIPHLEEALKEAPSSNGVSGAIEGDVAENLRILIEAGATLDYVNKDEGLSIPVLAECLSSLTAPITQQLIDAGADPFMLHTSFDEYDTDDEAPKSASTMVLKDRLNRDPEVVALFQQAISKLPVDSQAWEAIQQGNLAALQKVWPHLDKQSIVNSDGESLLQLAIKDKHLAITTWLLSQDVDLTHKDKIGNTALSLAVISKQTNVVQIIARKGAELNDNVCIAEITDDDDAGADKMMEVMGLGADNELMKMQDEALSATKLEGSDSTVLMYAANEGDLSTVQALVTAGAEIEQKDDSGITAICYAAWNGHLACVKFLHEKEAQANIAWSGGHILERAAYKGHMDVCEYLVKVAGLDINMKSKNGAVALVSAAESVTFHADTELAEVDGRESVDNLTPLLDLGADVNAQDKDGNCALLICTMFSYIPGIELLLSRGASTDLVSKDGVTAYRAAREVASLPEGFDDEILKPKQSATRYKEWFLRGKNFLLYRLLPIGALLGGAYYISPILALIVMLVWGAVLARSYFKRKAKQKLAGMFSTAGAAIGKAALSNAKDNRTDRELLDEWDKF